MPISCFRCVADMRVCGVHLNNFRNYRELDLTMDSDISVFYGENAQGKTNVLEAIYLCSCLRSHRTSKDVDMISHGETFFDVRLDYIEDHQKIPGYPVVDHSPVIGKIEKKTRGAVQDFIVGKDETEANENAPFVESISVSYYESVIGDPTRIKNKRVIKHNGIILPRTADLMGLFHAVIFAPEDLMLIKEGPANRRRFIDILISQIRASYFSELWIYNKILNQRNNLLKQIRDGRAERDYEQMAIWDHVMAKSAAKIIASRMDFTKKIGEIASKYHKDITSGKEEIYVKYKTISGIGNEESSEGIKNIIIEKLKTMYYEDIERGNTIYGPHRDDLEISLDGEGIRPFASQGQQRTAVLSLKMAELEIIRMETGDTPVLLLDDVMSELDSKRRKMLLASIGNAQIILTCTDQSHITEDFLEESPDRTIRYYQVQNGTVSTVGKIS